jgi:hypothetical protein
VPAAAPGAATRSISARSFQFWNLVAQHSATKYVVGHHRHAEFLAGADPALLFRIAREE